MAKNLMIQGTMSGAGKSILTAGLLRLLLQDGFKVSPFKSQNMALNSYVTPDGREVGRAQALQAIAAGRTVSADMNPILLKPTGESASQVIVNGLPVGDMDAREYFSNKRKYVPDILNAYERLSKDSDIIVIEGAGSPVEINLRSEDIVNMGLAELVDANVLLVGNIDPGGVFAQLLGTVNLMPQKERDRVKGLIINKFRGDISLLTPGLSMFKEYCDIPFAGVIPYMELDLDEEDSLSDILREKDGFSDPRKVHVAVIRLPYISNYTDYWLFERLEDVELIYTQSAEAVADADFVIIPGTKNTLADLKWMREKGLDVAVKAAAERYKPVIGICGGFQILGMTIDDEKGLSLLPVKTRFADEKELKQVEGVVPKIKGSFESLSGKRFSGYEIHMGRTDSLEGDIGVIANGKVLGTYIHGFFDSVEIAEEMVRIMYDTHCIRKPVPAIESRFANQDKELDRLAVCLRENLDMDLVYRAIGI